MKGVAESGIQWGETPTEYGRIWEEVVNDDGVLSLVRLCSVILEKFLESETLKGETIWFGGICDEGNEHAVWLCSNAFDGEIVVTMGCKFWPATSTLVSESVVVVSGGIAVVWISTGGCWTCPTSAVSNNWRIIRSPYRTLPATIADTCSKVLKMKKKKV